MYAGCLPFSGGLSDDLRDAFFKNGCGMNGRGDQAECNSDRNLDHGL